MNKHHYYYYYKFQPGKVYDEPGCKKCQCIDNAYSCQPGSCSTKASLSTEGTTEEKEKTSGTTIIKTAATEGTEADTYETTKTIKTSSTEGTEGETTEIKTSPTERM